MKQMFGRGPALQLRLFLAIVVAVSLMLADSRLGVFSQVRYGLNSLVAPLQYAANLPRDLLSVASQQWRSRDFLIGENARLKDTLLVQKSDVLLLNQLQQENQRLRDLLGSLFVRDERKMIAQVMAVDSDPYSHQIMIDKGHIDGVYEGQPVINDKGVVGQIAYVGAHNSRVLLLTDPMSGIPIQVLRNDIRAIANGRGQWDQLQLEHVPSSADIQVGDLLVSSGLGGRFPEGYPIGRVTEFSFDNERPFALVTADPAVDFSRLRYVLLVWPTPNLTPSPTPSSPNLVSQGAPDA